MKKILITLILAGFSVVSSAANWTPIAVLGTGIFLSARPVSKLDGKGNVKAEMRFEYKIPMKSSVDSNVAYSIAEIEINCFTKVTRMTGDHHFARNGGQEVKEDTNRWSKTDKLSTPEEGSAAALVVKAICPRIST